MPTPHIQDTLDDPITRHMRTEFARLHIDQTIGDALSAIRTNPPSSRVTYFYVVDDEGRLQGVVPVRRLLLSPLDKRVEEIMVREVITLPKTATVLDACDFFILHRLLAFPVVDKDRRILGIVDVELYTNELIDLDRTRTTQRSVSVDRRTPCRGPAVILRRCLSQSLSLASGERRRRHPGGVLIGHLPGGTGKGRCLGHIHSGCPGIVRKRKHSVGEFGNPTAARAEADDASHSEKTAIGGNDRPFPGNRQCYGGWLRGNPVAWQGPGGRGVAGRHSWRRNLCGRDRHVDTQPSAVLSA